MRITGVLVALCIAAVAANHAPRYRLSLPASSQHAISDLGLDVKASADDVLTAFVSEEEHNTLRSRGVKFIVEEEAQPLRTKFANTSFPGYLDLAGIYRFLQETQNRYPAIARVVDMTGFGPGKTFEGRTMPMIKISGNVAEDENEPQILILSAHHAREIITPVIAMDIITELTSQYATDPEVRRIVDTNEIFIAPEWNPDGYEFCWNTNNMWRKNRKRFDLTPPAFGVDQNRNYEYGWNSACAGDTNPRSEVYKGPSPVSEEETRIITAFGRARQFTKVLDFHSFGREVLISQRCNAIPAGVAAFNTAEGTKLARLANYVTRLPTGDGQHQGFHMHLFTAYSFLVETHTAFQPSFAEARAESRRVQPLVRHFLTRAVPLSGHVTDSATGRPVIASFTVNNFYSATTFPRSNEPRFGRYALWLPAGTFTVNVSAPGYQTQSRTVEVTADTPTVIDFMLFPPRPQEVAALL